MQRQSGAAIGRRWPMGMRRFQRLTGLVLLAGLLASCPAPVDQAERYNVVVNVNNPAWGSVTGSALNANGTVGQSFTWTAEPASGHRFVQWSFANAGGSSTENPLSHTISGPETITAVFAALDEVSIELSSATATAGQSITVTFSVPQAPGTPLSLVPVFSGTATEAEYTVVSEELAAAGSIELSASATTVAISLEIASSGITDGHTIIIGLEASTDFVAGANQTLTLSVPPVVATQIFSTSPSQSGVPSHARSIGGLSWTTEEGIGSGATVYFVLAPKRTEGDVSAYTAQMIKNGEYKFSTPGIAWATMDLADDSAATEQVFTTTPYGLAVEPNTEYTLYYYAENSTGTITSGPGYTHVSTAVLTELIDPENLQTTTDRTLDDDNVSLGVSLDLAGFTTEVTAADDVEVYWLVRNPTGLAMPSPTDVMQAIDADEAIIQQFGKGKLEVAGNSSQTIPVGTLENYGSYTYLLLVRKVPVPGQTPPDYQVLSGTIEFNDEEPPQFVDEWDPSAGSNGAWIVLPRIRDMNYVGGEFDSGGFNLDYRVNDINQTVSSLGAVRFKIFSGQLEESNYPTAEQIDDFGLTDGRVHEGSATVSKSIFGALQTQSVSIDLGGKGVVQGNWYTLVIVARDNAGNFSEVKGIQFIAQPAQQ